MAVAMLLAAQYAVSSLTFPTLLTSWRRTLAAASSGGVMLCLAAALSGSRIVDTLPAMGWMMLWLVALAILSAALSPRQRLIASALIATYAIGGALLGYVAADFGVGQNMGSKVGDSIVLGPIWVGVVSETGALKEGGGMIQWGIVGIVMLATIAWGIKKWLNRDRIGAKMAT